MYSGVEEYVKSSENICVNSIISIMLIFLFIISPINKFIMTSFIGKICILILLGYTFYLNILLTNKFSKNFNLTLLNGKWNMYKTNLTCSYIFSIFLFVLLLSVVRCIL